MSLIERILSEDLDNCQHTLVNDKVLKELETRFYEIIESLDEDIQNDLEDITSAFNARTSRIAYTQGILDACELLVDIKQSPLELLEKYKL